MSGDAGREDREGRARHDANAERASVASPARGLTRRAVLAGSVKAMPVVLTLHSGAALARSSNLIRGSGTIDTDGNYRCLATQHLTPLGDGVDSYDFGEPPALADVAVIPDTEYRTLPNNGKDSEVVSVYDMCANGGEYHYQGPGGWNCVRVQQGMLVSSTALGSFGGNLNFPSINSCEL